ncbi:50S ribosomal protein L4 [Feifania hominis]|uniref:Large ribosomal subunit protein uL4 n=1 Tax=Feifania hominis TaxID=2763660 RepID=A0A926HV90_9FIRM|nr:50S ribosomal protein L4 [Feifania hominis]MBC8537093.1 50S ribosomal protein L4 [Feifania hominis]
MANVKVYDMAGKEVGSMELSDSVFGVEVNKTVLHQAVVAYLANQRQGTQSALTRAEVSGGGAKPWRQKGTGRARQGSTRAPQWTHGGVAFAPKPRCYRVVLNKKVKRLALKSALSSKVVDNSLFVLNSAELDAIKTKKVVSLLEGLGLGGQKTLIVTNGVNRNLVLSARNLPGVKTAVVENLNVYDILKYDNFVVVQDAAQKIEEVYA